MATAHIEMPLTKGQVALVDLEDFEYLKDYSWCAVKVTASNTWYAMTKNKEDRTIYMHSLVSGFSMTDHIDTDGLNNRKENLRRATSQQNGRNVKLISSNSSGMKGVSFRKDNNNWRARIRIDNKFKNLGHFHSPEEAGHAYDQAAREHYREFGRYNFPLPGERGVRD